MGTDIHGVFQAFDNGQWRDVESSYEQDRHYQLFAVLAGVRNGYGFAGVPTGEPVTPIAARTAELTKPEPTADDHADFRAGLDAGAAA